jgi:zinc transporter
MPDAGLLPTTAGLICALQLDGKGGGTPLDWDQVYGYEPKNGVIWLHLDHRAEDARSWLLEKSGIDPITCEALIATDPRPRCVEHDKGVLMILRGVNLNEGAQPEDMVSLRVWADRRRIVTLRHRRSNAAMAVREALRTSKGPRNVSEFVVYLIDSLISGINTVADDLDDKVAKLEDEVIASRNYQVRHQLADMRRRAIGLRRYVAPERDVMFKLHAARAPWLRDRDRVRLAELADRMTRIIEDLEAARERAAVTQEEVATRLGELMNERLYVLSVVAALFLPLSVITGLWGMSVGGIPLGSHPSGFLIVSGLLILLTIGMLVFFRMKRWI